MREVGQVEAPRAFRIALTDCSTLHPAAQFHQHIQSLTRDHLGCVLEFEAIEFHEAARSRRAVLEDGGIGRGLHARDEPAARLFNGFKGFEGVVAQVHEHELAARPLLDVGHPDEVVAGLGAQTDVMRLEVEDVDDGVEFECRTRMSAGFPGVGEAVAQVDDAGVDGDHAFEITHERGLEPMRQGGALGAQGALEQVFEEGRKLGREAVVEAGAGLETPSGDGEEEAVPLAHRFVGRGQGGEHEAPDQWDDVNDALALEEAMLLGKAFDEVGGQEARDNAG